MDIELKMNLEHCETDLEGALKRFSGDEALYISCLKSFLKDPTVHEMNLALAAHSWDDAFTAAHALKGLAGNMGFIPLYYAAAELVLIIRSGRLAEIDGALAQVMRRYADITDAISLGMVTK